MLEKLIKQLKKSEKRKITLLSHQMNKNDNVKYLAYLQNILSNKNLGNRNLFINQNQTHNYRFKITQFVLHSLLSDEIQKNIKQNILFQLQECQLLFNRKLYYEGFTLVNKILKKSSTYEFFNIKMEALHLMGNFMLEINEAEGKILFSQIEFKKLKEEKNSVIQYLAAHEELGYLIQEFLLIVRQDRYLRHIEFEKFGVQLENNNLIQTHLQSPVFRLKYLSHLILGLYYISCGKLSESRIHFIAILGEFDKRTEFIELMNPEYYGAVYNFLLNSNKQFDYSSPFLKYLNHYEQFIKTHEERSVNFYIVKLTWLIKTWRLNELNKLMSEISVKHDQQQLHFNNAYFESDLYLTISVCYFITGNLECSLKWLNKILMNNKFDAISEIKVVTKVMQLIIHYELENFELLNSLVPSLKRFLKKFPDKFKTERIFVDCFQQLLKINSSKIKTDFFKSWLNKYEVLFENYQENSINNYIDFKVWLLSKISRKSYQDEFIITYSLMEH